MRKINSEIMCKFVNVSCLSPMHCLHYFIFICLMYHCPVILYCEAFYYFLQLVLTFFILSDFAQSSVLNSTHLPSGTPLTTIYHSSSLATSGSSAFFVPVAAYLPQVPHNSFWICPLHIQNSLHQIHFPEVCWFLPRTHRAMQGMTSLYKGCLDSSLDVLVWAGRELIFFLVGALVLCFGFCKRTMLVTRWCFSCCQEVTPSQGLFSFLYSASEQEHKELGGSRARRADLNWPQGYSRPQNVLLST